MAVPEGAVPRRSTIAPISADERERRAQAEVSLALTDRLLSEQRVAHVAHLVLLSVCVWLLAGVLRTPMLTAWAGAVVIAVIVRGILMSGVKTIDVSPAAAARAVRLSVVSVGLAWGVGAAVYFPEIPMRYVTLILLTEAGLVSGAAWTLTADLRSFRLFLLATLGPLPFGVWFNTTPDSTRAREVAIVLVTLYGAYMWVQGRRSHLALVAMLRASALLRIREEETSRQNAFLGALFASAPIAMAELTPDGIIERVNPRFVTMFGYAEYEAVGREINELIVPPAEHDRGWMLQQSVLDGDVVAADLRRLTKSGQELAVLASAAVVNREDGTKGIVVLYEDVSERRRAEARIREAEAHFRQLLDSSGEGIYGVDVEGHVTFFNPEASSLTGFTLPEVLGKGSHELLHHTRPDGAPYPAKDCPVYRALRDGQGIRMDDEVFWRKDGTPFPVSLTAFPLRELNGSVSGAVVTFTDTSERVAAREAIEHARDAAERDSGIDGAPVRHAPRTGATPLPGPGTLGRRDAAHPAERHPGPLEDRGRSAQAREHPFRPGSPDRIDAGPARRPGPREAPRSHHGRAARRAAERPGRPDPATPDPHEPGRQCDQVHRPGRGGGGRLQAGTVGRARRPAAFHSAGYRDRDCAGQARNHLRGIHPGRFVHDPPVRRHRPRARHLPPTGPAAGGRAPGREPRGQRHGVLVLAPLPGREGDPHAGAGYAGRSHGEDPGGRRQPHQPADRPRNAGRSRVAGGRNRRSDPGAPGAAERPRRQTAVRPGDSRRADAGPRRVFARPDAAPGLGSHGSPANAPDVGGHARGWPAVPGAGHPGIPAETRLPSRSPGRRGVGPPRHGRSQRGDAALDGRSAPRHPHSPGGGQSGQSAGRRHHAPEARPPGGRRGQWTGRRDRGGKELLRHRAHGHPDARDGRHGGHGGDPEDQERREASHRRIDRPCALG